MSEQHDVCTYPGVVPAKLWRTRGGSRPKPGRQIESAARSTAINACALQHTCAHAHVHGRAHRSHTHASSRWMCAHMASMRASNLHSVHGVVNAATHHIMLGDGCAGHSSVGGAQAHGYCGPAVHVMTTLMRCVHTCASYAHVHELYVTIIRSDI